MALRNGIPLQSHTESFCLRQTVSGNTGTDSRKGRAVSYPVLSERRRIVQESFKSIGQERKAQRRIQDAAQNCPQPAQRVNGTGGKGGEIAVALEYSPAARSLSDCLWNVLCRAGDREWME